MPTGQGKSAATTGISYIVGGLIRYRVLFSLRRTPFQGLLISALLTIICLFSFWIF